MHSHLQSLVGRTLFGPLMVRSIQMFLPAGWSCREEQVLLCAFPEVIVVRVRTAHAEVEGKALDPRLLGRDR